MLILVLKMLKTEQRKQVPAAEPKRHSKSRLGRPARSHPADLTARADGQADVQMVVDGTCADTVCMTLARLKQLLGEEQHCVKPVQAMCQPCNALCVSQVLGWFL